MTTSVLLSARIETLPGWISYTAALTKLLGAVNIDTWALKKPQLIALRARLRRVGLVISSDEQPRGWIYVSVPDGGLDFTCDDFEAISAYTTTPMPSAEDVKL